MNQSGPAGRLQRRAGPNPSHRVDRVAKAVEKRIEWVWLSQAYEQACAIERSKELAERHLRKAIVNEQLEHCVEILVIGGRFSQQREFPNERLSRWCTPVLDFEWMEDQAEGWLIEIGADNKEEKRRFFAYRIKVSKAGLQRLYPELAAATDAKASDQKRVSTRRGPRSSAPLVLAEAETRLRGKNRRDLVRQGRKRFLQGIADWLSETHPKAKPMAGKTIGDHLRDDARVRALLPPEWLRRK